ncbi:hypothetical protein CFOL_v3_07060, partial [Cephalotus follicularis]
VRPSLFFLERESNDQSNQSLNFIITFKTLTLTFNLAMDDPKANPVCSQEALDLLNCVTLSPYHEKDCVLLLQSLRRCVLNKKVKNFLLADQSKSEANSTSKKSL